MSDESNTTNADAIQAGSAFDQQLARIAVGAYDDAQDVRTAMLNRVRDVVRKRNEDIPFDAVEEEKEDEDRSYGDQYNDDNLPDLIRQMHDEGKLSTDEFEYLREMLEAGQAAEKIEQQYKNVMQITETEPIYAEYLTNVYGVSTVLTARLLHRFGYCEDFDRVSELWSYSGLAPGQKREKGKKLGYDPEAKKLAWLVADGMVRQGSRSRYREEFYDPYKEKQIHRMGRAEEMTEAQLEQVEWTPPESQGHADARARRYLGKKFLKHYWYIAREMKGLDVPDEYIITHGGHEKREDTFENPAYAKRVLAER